MPPPSHTRTPDHFLSGLFVFLDFLPIWGQLILFRNRCWNRFLLHVYLGKKSIAMFDTIKSICFPESLTRMVSCPLRAPAAVPGPAAAAPLRVPGRQHPCHHTLAAIWSWKP